MVWASPNCEIVILFFFFKLLKILINIYFYILLIIINGKFTIDFFFLHKYNTIFTEQILKFNITIIECIDLKTTDKTKN